MGIASSQCVSRLQAPHSRCSSIAAASIRFAQQSAVRKNALLLVARVSGPNGDLARESGIKEHSNNHSGLASAGEILSAVQMAPVRFGLLLDNNSTRCGRSTEDQRYYWYGRTQPPNKGELSRARMHNLWSKKAGRRIGERKLRRRGSVVIVLRRCTPYGVRHH